VTVKRPAIRYHGGKWRLAPLILQHLPAHRYYIEPFGGAASVLLRKKPAHQEVYNDLDGDMVVFFSVIRNPVLRDRLLEALTLTPYAREEFELAFEPTDDPVERARRVAIRAQMGFGSAGATKGTTGFRTDVKRQYGTSMHLWAQFPESILALHERFKSVLIENRPALRVIEMYDDPQSLFFVDPPYVHSTRYRDADKGYYYRHEMTNDDHDKLLDALNNIKGMCVLTGYRTEQYDAALSGWARVDKQVAISSYRGTATRMESIWISPNCQHNDLLRNIA